MRGSTLQPQSVVGSYSLFYNTNSLLYLHSALILILSKRYTYSWEADHLILRTALTSTLALLHWLISYSFVSLSSPSLSSPLLQIPLHHREVPIRGRQRVQTVRSNINGSVWDTQRLITSAARFTQRCVHVYSSINITIIVVPERGTSSRSCWLY